MSLKAGAAGNALKIATERPHRSIEAADQDRVVVVLRALKPFAGINQDTLRFSVVIAVNCIAAFRHRRISFRRIEFKHTFEAFTLHLRDRQGAAP